MVYYTLIIDARQCHNNIVLWTYCIQLMSHTTCTCESSSIGNTNFIFRKQENTCCTRHLILIVQYIIIMQSIYKSTYILNQHIIIVNPYNILLYQELGFQPNVAYITMSHNHAIHTGVMHSAVHSCNQQALSIMQFCVTDYLILAKHDAITAVANKNIHHHNN